ncbi:MAG: helix-turn-helix domain-containing protein [Armatimonadota bacterium]|nr:helix-turn-helix domain-containing protein [Armatimonadota bacterium]MDR7497177.1 helix-turn-helix domain-containing protein [Armatimonadota bacterium]
MLTVEQVAAYLQLNRLTVYRYIREGRIPASRLGKLYRVLKSDVDRFLESQRVGGGAESRSRPAAPPPGERVRSIRPRVASEREVHVGPPWRERRREREALTEAIGLHTSDVIEWVLRGVH